MNNQQPGDNRRIATPRPASDGRTPEETASAHAPTLVAGAPAGDATAATAQVPVENQDETAAPTRGGDAPPRGRGRRRIRTNLLLAGVAALITVLIVLLAGLLTGGFRFLRENQETVARPLILQPTGAPGESFTGSVAGQTDTRSSVPSPGPPPGAAPAVGPRFQVFYELRGGVRLLGRPISEPLLVNGREIQWFERARLEHWPEFAGTPYEIQPGLVGVEYTQGRSFPTQTFFNSRPDLRYFAETGHAVGGRFLRFWEQNGGLDTFGYPISEEFDEQLDSGASYRVQYFERARLEYHPEFAGTPNEIQLGLLGRALYLNESRPTTIPPLPTPVPLS